MCPGLVSQFLQTTPFWKLNVSTLAKKRFFYQLTREEKTSKRCNTLLRTFPVIVSCAFCADQKIRSQRFQICEMRRHGRGGSPSPSPTPPPPPSPNCKVEAGVKEINSALCSAMFGLVLSDQAYREFQARQLAGQDKVETDILHTPLSVFSFLRTEDDN